VVSDASPTSRVGRVLKPSPRNRRSAGSRNRSAGENEGASASGGIGPIGHRFLEAGEDVEFQLVRPRQVDVLYQMAVAEVDRTSRTVVAGLLGNAHEVA
jgi:hypothetical protein